MPFVPSLIVGVDYGMVKSFPFSDTEVLMHAAVRYEFKRLQV